MLEHFFTLHLIPSDESAASLEIFSVDTGSTTFSFEKIIILSITFHELD